MSRKVSINRKEGSILPIGVEVTPDPITHKMKPKKILENAKPIADKVINGIIYKMRVDVGLFCKDIYEANILRILLVNKGRFEQKHLDDYNLDVIIDIDGKLFNHKKALVVVDYSFSDSNYKNIIKFRDEHPDDKFNKMYLITAEDSGYTREKYEMDRSYEWFEKQYKGRIALWETKRQNVDKTPDLYKRQWVIGKKELKRKHKKFFQPEGKSVKIGQLWKKQPFIGRPKYDNMFMDTFKIYDSETNELIFNHDNWGSIVQEVRRHMKDNAYEYYNTERYAICAGHVKKTDEWVDIIRYDTMATLYLNKEHFITKENRR